MSRWEPNASGRLQRAALELYSERGYDQTTVTEIAKRAGLTERTFFRYFADKREVLFYGSGMLQERLVQGIDDAPATLSPLDAVGAALIAAAEPIEEIREFSPPFLGALQEPGLIQLWTGLVARTAPGWSLLVRAPANVPRSGTYELFEGIIETDHWFGPLITNMRLTKTDVPIDFRADFPLLQVQPLPRQAYEDTTLNNYELVPDLKQLTPEDWDDYYDTVVRPHVQEVRPRGQYAAAARKRRAAEAGDTSAE